MTNHQNSAIVATLMYEIQNQGETEVEIVEDLHCPALFRKLFVTCKRRNSKWKMRQ